MAVTGIYTSRCSRHENSVATRKLVLPLILFAAVSGCATPQRSSASLDQHAPAALTGQTPTVAAPASRGNDAPTDQKARNTELTIVRKSGTGEFLNATDAPPPTFLDPVSGEADEFNVNMVDVPIDQAAEALLRDTLGLSYMVAPGTTGRVTIRTASPLSRAALFDAFQSALKMNGYSLRREQDTYIIAGQGSATRRFLIGTQSVGGVNGVHVVPLKFIAASEMQSILQPIAANALQIGLIVDRNIILVSGAKESVSAALEAVELFDVDIMQGKSVSRVELTSANPTAVAAELSVIFDTGPGGALAGVIEFIPNNILGSVLIISSSPRYAREAEKWIKGYENAVRTEIYELRNRSASDLSGVLSGLMTNGAGGAAPIAAATAPGAGPLPPTAAAPAAQGAGVTIVADETANAIIVHATASKQREVERLIKRLDNVADQVLIEAMIAEVQLNDSLTFGVRHFFESGNFSSNFSALVAGGASALYPGLNAVFDDGGTLTAAIDALSSVTNVNIISSPSLLVLDNREAILNVGDQVPVITQTSSSVTDPDAPIVNAVSYRDTGVILRVRPRVDNSGRVILDINQEVSDAVTTETSEIDAPTIQQRSIETTVAVDDGQSLMLGGLIRETDTNTRAKVPLLGDVPVLGAPFRRTETSSRRTELLVIITPRVVRNPNQAQSITEEYRKKLSAPGALIRDGGYDGGSVLERIAE